MTDALVRLDQVTKAYPTATEPFVALAGVTASIARGVFCVIHGKSGAGKSSLINMIGGIDLLSAGRVWVDNQPIHSMNQDELAAWRGKNVGVVYQSFELLPSLSLIDNVMLPMELAGLYHKRSSPSRALELLDMVGIAEHAYKQPSQVSGGQRQRAAIARAMANRPALLLADEPTGNLDSSTASDVLALFDELVHAGTTLIMVTHDRSLTDHADQVLNLRDGRLVRRVTTPARETEYERVVA